MNWQLKNIRHDFDVAEGDVGVTVRLGRKWANRCTGHIVGVDLWECDKPHEGPCPLVEKIREDGEVIAEVTHCKYRGKAKVIGVWYGELHRLPPALLALEHEKSSRTLDGLRKSLKRGYGREIGDDEEVTAVIYYRTEVAD